MAARGQKRVYGVVFLLFPIRKSCFELLKVHKSEDRGVSKCQLMYLEKSTTQLEKRATSSADED